MTDSLQQVVPAPLRQLVWHNAPRRLVWHVAPRRGARRGASSHAGRIAQNIPVRALIGAILIACLLAAPFGAAAAQSDAAAAAATVRPNIVFILTDDQRWDALACAGNPIVRTPNLDTLAATGARFTNMFCTTSICATSRATFLTGQWERRHGIDNFRTPLTPAQFAQSFPGLLRQHGYRTGLVGKWGLGGKPPRDQYDDFRGFPGQGRYFPKGQEGQAGAHLTHRLADQAIDFLSTCPPNKPFLLQFYTKAAHAQDGDPWPFQPDPRYQTLYADLTIPLPRTATEEHFQRLPPFLKTSEARVRWRQRFATAELYQKSVKDYYRLVTGVDDAVGRIVEKLRAMNVLANTVIIFTSDNGFYLGEFGLAGKWFMHEPSIRLPLIIHDPRMPAGRRGVILPPIVLNTDIAPTILDLAGVARPATMQGRSLVPLLRGQDVPWRKNFFYEHRFRHPRIPTTEGVRTERWKYTRYTSIEPVYEELFDLQADPDEERNLAADPRVAEKLAELRERCGKLAQLLQ